jgi:LmbE family N-acetylglucosaminyl deacetylase
MSTSYEPTTREDRRNAPRARTYSAAAIGVAVVFLAVTARAQTLQIVAHQDDDILFMNPDLRNGLQSGTPSTTIFVTAGEAQGAYQQTREQFAANRQEGARAAYASMMGVTFQGFGDFNTFPKDVDGKWTRSLCLIEGNYVEVDQLKAATQVKLVFLNVPEAGDNVTYNGMNPIVHLFYDEDQSLVSTIVPENWPTEPCVWPEFALSRDVRDVPSPSYYDHAKLDAVLVALFRKVQPGVVRTLDPYPYESLCGDNVDNITCYPPNPACLGVTEQTPIGTCANSNTDPPTVECTTDGDCGVTVNPYFTGYLVRFDNIDHQVTARFVREALASYGQHGTTQNYIGYSITDRQGNLSDNEYPLKRATTDIYGDYDHNYLDAFAHGGLGYLSWFGATYERNPSSTTWLQRFRDGRLAAFGVRGDRAVLWYEICPGGGDWYGPITLGNDSSVYGAVAPGIAVGARGNGLLQLFFLRTPQVPMAADTQICTVAQDPARDAFRAEVCLGSPSPTGPGSNWISAPAVATDADQHFWIFVRNGAGGVSANHEIDRDVWSGWSDLPGDPENGEASGGGPDVLEGIVTARDGLQRINVFAQTRFGVIHQWYQQSVGGPWVFVPVFPSNAPVYLTHGLGVANNADGRLEVFYRGAGRTPLAECGCCGCNAQVFSVREQSVGGAWGAETDLFGDHGRGPLAVVRHASGPLQVFQLNYYGGVSAIGETSPNGSFSPFQWTDLGGRIVHFPSATIDSVGRTVLGAFGLDGKLYIRRQQTTSASSSFSDWRLVDKGLLPPASPRNICLAGKKT